MKRLSALVAITPLLLSAGVSSAADSDLFTGRRVSLSADQKSALTRDFRSAAGPGAKAENITPVKTKRGTYYACGYAKTASGKRPFWAEYKGGNSSARWDVKLAKRADINDIGTHELCRQMNATLPDMQKFFNSTASGSGSGSNFKMTSQQLSVVTESVTTKLRAGSVAGLIARSNPKGIVTVCGFGVSSGQRIPFSGVIVKNAKGVAREFMVTATGEPGDKKYQGIKTWGVHRLCKDYGITLPGNMF